MRKYNTREIAIPPEDDRPEWLEGLIGNLQVGGFVFGLIGLFYILAWAYGHFRWGW